MKDRIGTPGSLEELQQQLAGAMAPESVEELQRQFAAALEQQAATARILEVINRSGGDLEPVYQAVLDAAQRLLLADSAAMVRVVGQELETVAVCGATQHVAPGLAVGLRLEINARTVAGIAALERRTVHVPDVSQRPELPQNVPWTRLAVPILHADDVVGVISVAHGEVRPFTPREIALLETFAGQVGIAVENARLLNESKEGLERQTAIAEILRAISASPTDVQPVLDAIAKNAARFCGAEDATVLLVKDEQIEPAAHYGSVETALERTGGTRSLPIGRANIGGRAILERRVIQVDDILAMADEFPWSAQRAREFGWRSAVVAPLLREGEPLGLILLRRADVRPFTPKQVDLLQTFAAQAVIAIENVRLFNETKEALAQQTATAQVLKTISRSAFDLQPVLGTLVDNAARLCHADVAWVSSRQPDGERLRAVYGFSDEERTEMERAIAGRTEPPPASVMRRVFERAATIHLPDITVEPDTYAASTIIRVLGGRTVLAVPVRRDNAVVAGFVLLRRDVRAFSDREVELVESFADQAAIAIENVRLFTETKASLDRETALADVLRTIANSPNDLQPVLDTIARSAATFCRAENVMVALSINDDLQMRAHYGFADLSEAQRRANFWGPARVSGRHPKWTSVSGRAFLDRQVVHVPDALELDEAEFATAVADARTYGDRALLAAPLIRQGESIGVILLRRTEPGAFTNEQVNLVRTFADQAVIAIENVRLFNETKEALEQQTATSEVLKVISRSTFELQPVFDAVVVQAARLCEASDAFVFRLDPDGYRLAAAVGRMYASPELRERRMRDAVVPGPGTFHGRVALEGRTIHIPDVLAPDAAEGLAGESAEHIAKWSVHGVRTLLGVPMVRTGQVVGVIGVARPEPRPFSAREIRLVETFADQAAIAVENVRLFNETKDALERETATSEVLRAISGSAFDLDPVLSKVAELAVRLTGADNADILHIQGGDTYREAAHYGETSDEYRKILREGTGRIRRGRGTLMGRVLEDKRAVQIVDVLADPEYEWHEAQRASGFRTLLGVPLLRDGVLIGAIAVWKRRVEPFTEEQISLISTFADQAVIAIENVRLFNETKDALERQTAISEILRVISESPTDVQPVLDAIADSAMHFCAAEHAIVNLIAGSMIRPVAGHRSVLDPFPLDRTTVTGRSMVDVRTLSVRDLADPSYAQEFPLGHAQAIRSAERAIVATPMVREGRAVGGIVLWRAEPTEFTDRQIQLVETFARQAAIAIENVRLFNETKEALEQQTASADVLKVISSSAFELQPVLDTIVANMARLCSAERAGVFLREGEVYRQVARKDGTPPSDDVRPGRSRVVGRVALERRTVQISDVLADPEYDKDYARQVAPDIRTLAGVPLLRDGEVLGVLAIARGEVRPFTDRELRIVETFADQAVIAIENVRLFNETREALEQQTATAEILDVISRSTNDLRPVFEAIAQMALRLCEADTASINQREGETFRNVASAGMSAEERQTFLRAGPLPLRPGRGSLTGRVLLERRSVQIPDSVADPEYDLKEQYAAPEAFGQPTSQSLLGVPILRAGEPIGVIILRREPARPFADKQISLVESFAAQAVIAIENVRLFNETKESLEQQTATGEVLKAISRSPFALQSVLDTVIETAAKLCGAEHGYVYRVGDTLELLASHGSPLPEYEAFLTEMAHRNPGRTPSWKGSVIGRVARERRVEHFVDLLTDSRVGGSPDPEIAEFWRDLSKISRNRSAAVVPLLRGDEAIGVMALWRERVAAFTERELQLVQTFADQAAIAIENARLFNETKESLERQTAISEILRVIAASPADMQPVLRVIADSARRYCAAEDAAVVLVRDGMLVPVAHEGALTSDAWGLVNESGLIPPYPLDRTTVSGRAVVEQRTNHVADLQAEAIEYPLGSEQAKDGGYHTVLATPLLRESGVLGVILLRRENVEPFSERQVDLVKTFADQAVIAIENVRLFNETKEALERQTAISEILRVISESPTDIQPVLDAIAQNAARYCQAEDATVMLPEGGELRGVAHFGPLPLTPASRGPGRVGYPIGRDSMNGRAFIEKKVLHTADIWEQADEYPLGAAASREVGARAALVAPLLREGSAIGTIALRRRETRAFSAHQIELVQTFADQAVIAIENVRLFNETKEALDRQTAIAGILRAISESPTDVQPVLDAIAESAARFCAAEDAAVILVAGDQLRTRAHHGPIELLTPLAMEFPLDRGTVTGRSIVDRRAIHVHDLLAEPDDEYPIGKEQARRMGHRTTLATPLLREGAGIGAILLRRREVRPFSDHQVDLVRTFADQAVIAIENVRLFNETKEALERQTAISEVMKAIGSSLTETQQALDQVIAQATRLAGADNGFVYQRDGGVLRMTASFGDKAEAMREWQRTNPIKIDDRGASTGRAFADGRTVHIPDVTKDPEYTYWEAQKLGGFRVLLSVPMIRDGEPLGVLALWRVGARPFSDAEIKVVELFADQAVVAVENARLFNETKEALQRQTATSEVLEAISGSAFELQPIFDVIVRSAVTLCRADSANLWRADGGVFTLSAFVGDEPIHPIGTRFEGGSRFLGRVASSRDVIHVPDTGADELGSVDTRKVWGTRLGVAIVKDRDVLGVISLGRARRQAFSPDEIDLVKTFAGQAAIAIENVRLFNEIQDKSRQLEVASRHKSEFLANMSHELRTPLNAIIGFTDVMLEQMFGPLNEKQMEYLEDVRNSGNHLLTLINDILDLSKIEAGRVELEIGDFSFPAALENALTLVRERATRHGITLAAEVAPDVGTIAADERKVKQVLVNLLANAVKFTPDGGWVSVSAKRGNGAVEVAVRDTGIGVAAEDQERIFDEFQQVGRDPDKAREGTGLGLTLAKRFVELHGGRIWVDSEVGKGSTFTFSIPVRQTALVDAKG